MTATIKLKINNDGSIFARRQELENNDLTWRDAIELSPRPIATSKEIVIPQYNLEVTPIEITYTTIAASVAERIGIAIVELKNTFSANSNSVLQQIIQDPSQELNVNLLLSYHVTLNEKITAVSEATTHEELDTILGL